MRSKPNATPEPESKPGRQVRDKGGVVIVHSLSFKANMMAAAGELYRWQTTTWLATFSYFDIGLVADQLRNLTAGMGVDLANVRALPHACHLQSRVRVRVQTVAGMGVDLANQHAQSPAAWLIAQCLTGSVLGSASAWLPQSYPCCPSAGSDLTSVCPDVHLVGLAQLLVADQMEGGWNAFSLRRSLSRAGPALRAGAVHGCGHHLHGGHQLVLPAVAAHPVRSRGGDHAVRALRRLLYECSLQCWAT